MILSLQDTLEYIIISEENQQDFSVFSLHPKTGEIYPLVPLKTVPFDRYTVSLLA